MTNNQSVRAKKILIRGLLAITILGSFFCGGGYYSEAAAPQSSVFKTEITFAGYPDYRVSISFESAGSVIYEKYCPPITGNISFSLVNRQFNRLVKINIAQFTQPSFSVYTPSRFCRFKIPQPSPDEVPLRLHLG